MNTAQSNVFLPVRVDAAVAAIAKAARTGKIGDGKIFTLDLDSTLRVRTGETSESALD